jgi:hypothetical protein
MTPVSKLIYNTLEVGYLSLEAEQHLRELFASDRPSIDQAALRMLRRAIIAGYVQREADPIKQLTPKS